MTELNNGYPQTATGDTVDTYHGVRVEDPFRWLEESDSPPVLEWIDRQNAYTGRYLDAIPFRSAMKDHLRETWNYTRYSNAFRAGGRYFTFKNDGLQNQSVLYGQDSLDAEAEIYLDPNTFSDDGSAALNFVTVSKDGRYLAYGLSSGGSDWMQIRILDLESRQLLPDTIDRVKFSRASWHKNGFFYSCYDLEQNGNALTLQNRHHKVYYHRLGTQQSDDILVHEDKNNPHRNFHAYTSPDEQYLFITSQDGYANGNTLLFKDLRHPDTDVRALTDDESYSYYGIDGLNGKLLMITDYRAPRRRLVLVDPQNPEPAQWKDLVAEHAEAVLEGAYVFGAGILVSFMQNVASRLYVYSASGDRKSEIRLPDTGSVVDIDCHRDDSEVLFQFTSFSMPSAIYRYDGVSGETSSFKQAGHEFQTDEIETRQVFFRSRDGKRVPMFIICRKGLALDGNNPTVMYGYGGFNVSLTPVFSVSRFMFLQQGGVFVNVNLRGGGEYGEDWHKAGMLENKQTVFDDFISAAEYLVEQGYSRPERMAMMGGSNGGLLVGAIMTQRPELFAAAVPSVGVMDMLRFHKFTIGWAWISEYGSSDEPEQFHTLLKYSPLHNLREAVQYPATLVITADHDDRVVPAHSFKFIAELQRKAAPGQPALIRIGIKAGHGAGKPTEKIISEQSDIWSFIFYNLGMHFSVR